MPLGVMPPTGSRRRALGSTARSAFTMGGVISSAGKSLTASAPASTQAKASVGVAAPGTQYRPRALASATRRVSACGITMSWPPACCTRATASVSSTVPAPTTASPGRPCARRAMLSSGSGEFSGTSMSRKPAS